MAVTPNYGWPLPEEGEEFLDVLIREVLLAIDADIVAASGGAVSGIVAIAGEETVVASPAVQADSKIQLTSLSRNVTGILLVPADEIVVGTSFKIVTTNPLDAGDVAWSIIP